MSRRFLIILVSMCLLLIAIIILPSDIKHDFLSDKKESNTLFIINNQDNISHEVIVKLFDSKNTSIFDKSYTLASGEHIESQSAVGLATGTYIEVTLDNNITETEIVPQDLSDIAILYIDMYSDDLLSIRIAVP